MRTETVIAILAKAPIPGFAKTRLIPALGAHGAATLQDLLTEQAVATAVAAELGTVTLWGAPSCDYPSFRDLAQRFSIGLRDQPAGDLGARMLNAISAGAGPMLVTGVDCPHLTPSHLRSAAEALSRADIVAIPATDGGYVLIGMRESQPRLFSEMEWSNDRVMTTTRARVSALGLQLHELPPLPDIDRPEDLHLLSAHAALASFA